jgi:hypothetical protein
MFVLNNKYVAAKQMKAGRLDFFATLPLVTL